MENIKIGDIVVLNSGGPNMTVENIDGEKIVCLWFTDNGCKQENFKKEMLYHITDEDDKEMYRIS